MKSSFQNSTSSDYDDVEVNKNKTRSVHFLCALGVLIFMVFMSTHASSQFRNEAVFVSLKNNTASHVATTTAVITPEEESTTRSRVPSPQGATTNSEKEPGITNVTVFLTTPENPSDSIFKAGTLHRFGSGKIRYNIQEGNCTCDNTTEPVIVEPPCLAVSQFCDSRILKCHYPRCKTVITNDERCRKKGRRYDVREYYNADFPSKPYLPLGPRLDSWTSFQKIKASKGGQFTIIPASKRKYAFNAIFSKSTNDGRVRLANIIDNSHHNNNTNSQLTIFAQMAERWVKNINNPKRKSGHLHTDQYIQVVLDSTFTLAPTGHNPECFRLYEAIEAGSIPVFARDEDYANQNCKESLHAWLDVEPKAPILVLDSWDDVYSTIETLLQDPAALDDRQAQLSKWYKKHMRKVTKKFERYLLRGQ
ncbi:Transmembrane protein 5 [Seminavis robusta]|uniref:Transmembrane protein 5 n=1 Tax=Seminavis robusta TaxID=568900 RepID=A0A9N8ECE4_9STRA|nr:Transmembrane protein 5 [Seminavis robusta]|eukprot:Sro800_g204330.1 Transmembrane protein 5 (420) ;mRNA; f:32907-34166